MNAAWLWAVAGAVFVAGASIVMLRRQLVAMVLGLELMINAANLVIVCCAADRGDGKGLAVALLVVAAAAAEAVVGLSLILAFHRSGEPPDSDLLRELSG